MQEAGTVNGSKGVAVPKAAKEGCAWAPGTHGPTTLGRERWCPFEQGLLLSASVFSLFSSCSRGHRGVGLLLEEPGLKGAGNCLGFPLVTPSELGCCSPGCSPRLRAQPVSPNTRHSLATLASLLPYLLYLRSLSSHCSFIYNCI